jgi:uncharacterized lipoprotein YmbA
MKFPMLLAIVLVTGCTSSVPTLNQYLLRSDVPSQFSVTKHLATVGLGAVIVAPYIDGLGLVLESRDGEVRAARDHQWAEPLRDSLRVFMARETSVSAGQVIRAYDTGDNDWQRRIDLRIDQLHGTPSGEAKLVAYWQVFDTEKRTVISENGFSDTQALGADGYAALVVAEKALLITLAAKMAASL